MVDDDATPAPLPASMWLPFALLGATAAFFCVLGVALVMSDVRFVPPWSAPVSGAIAGALAGGLLRRWRGLHDPWLTPGKKLARVALVVLVAGAIVGASITWWAAREVFLALEGALSGTALAVLFIPGCSFVVDAAERATRARHGSIVAGADRRTVWGTALAAIAAAPVVAVPATAVGLVSFSLGPTVQPVLVIAAAAAGLLVLAGLEWQERRARGVLEAVVDSLGHLEPSAAVDVRSGGERDLGLGDGGFSRVHLRDAYRGTRHGEVVLRGDPDEAREALDDAVGRRRRTRVLGVLALIVSSFAAVGYGNTDRYLRLDDPQRIP